MAHNIYGRQRKFQTGGAHAERRDIVPSQRQGTRTRAKETGNPDKEGLGARVESYGFLAVVQDVEGRNRCLRKELIVIMLVSHAAVDILDLKTVHCSGKGVSVGPPWRSRE